MIVRIPTSLRKHVGGASKVEIDAATVADGLHGLTDKHAELRDQLFTSDAAVVPYINVFVNDQNIRDLQGLDTPVTDRDEVLLVPALAGG